MGAKLLLSLIQSMTSGEEDLVDSMRDLGIAHFAEVSALRYSPLILPF